MTKHIPHPANALFRTLEKLARDTDASQHDEHYRDYLNEIARRGEIVIRMPDGLLHLEDYTVNERTGERWVFTDKGRAVFAGVE